MNKKARILVTDKFGNSVEVEGYKEAARVANMPVATMVSVLVQGRMSRTGYMFDYASDYVLHSNLPYKEIEIVHKTTGEKQNIKGLNKMATFFNCTQSAVYSGIHRGELGEWFVKEIPNVRI